MKKCTTLTKLTQLLLTNEEMKQTIEIVGYHEKGRKFTVYRLLEYWIHAAWEEWGGFRQGADQARGSGLPSVNYSTFSKKASEVPYEVFKRLFHLLVSKCNRSTRRRLKIPSNLLLIDSTTITVGKNRLPWARYHGNRAGVKLHIALDARTDMPMHVTETIGIQHDGSIGEQLADKTYTLVQDRAYAKIERLDRFQKEGQFFVIRLAKNVQIVNAHSLQRLSVEGSPVTRDITCQLGTSQYRSERRHRIVFFQDDEGREIRVVTNLLMVSAERIAHMYKIRWRIEMFFRWIKQHLNVPNLFGTTPNAVYGQLYTALITYVLLKWLYEQVHPHIIRFCLLSFIRFARLLAFQALSVEWMMKIGEIFKLHSKPDHGLFTVNG